MKRCTPSCSAIFSPLDCHQIAVSGFAGTALLAQIGVHESGVIAVGNETDLEALALIRDGQVHFAGEIAHFRLETIAQREDGAGQLRLCQAEEEKGLVLRGSAARRSS